MKTEPKIISAHSLKGGAGKTTISFSTAIQIAKAGKRVAFLEFVCPGMISQYLFSSLTHPKSNLSSWMLSDTLQLTESESRFISVKSRKVKKNLSLFLAAPDLQTYTEFNDRFVMNREGQRRFCQKLEALISELGNLGFRYILIDNASGFNFLPSLVIAELLSSKAGNKANHNSEFWLISPGRSTDLAMLWQEVMLYFECGIMSRIKLVSIVQEKDKAVKVKNNLYQQIVSAPISKHWNKQGRKQYIQEPLEKIDVRVITQTELKKMASSCNFPE